MYIFNSLSLLEGIAILLTIQFLFILILIKQNKNKNDIINQLQNNFNLQLSDLQNNLQNTWQNSQHNIQERITNGQLNIQQLISDSVQKQMTDVREQMKLSFTLHSSSITSHLQTLTEEIRNHLHNLTQQVQVKLTEGFERTSNTFIDVVKRLAIIDEAQKKITELSTHVVSLQDILVDKKARGAFGEVQLSNLISNMIPSGNYKMQHTLSNQKRVDCMLFLPDPTGNIAIDAKFPLENYQRMVADTLSALDKKTFQQQFRIDIQKHIKDVAEKYIISGETAEGAILFIPAESIFAEIHANYPDLITLSHKLKVWMVSPSTLMAVLTTAKAVLKDDATRKQMHIIQHHLHALAEDFQRFEKRMDNLTKHIDMAHRDVNEVNTSARKITQRFQKIESVELETPDLLIE